MAYKPDQSLRVIWYLVASGGLVSVVGQQLLRLLSAVGWLVAELALGTTRDSYPPLSMAKLSARYHMALCCGLRVT